MASFSKHGARCCCKIAWVLLHLLFLAFVLAFKQQPSSTQRAGAEIHIEKLVFNKSNTVDEYELNISYPRIRYPLAEINHNVNVDIQRIMVLAITDFTEKVKKNKELNNKGGFSSLTLDYKVFFKQIDILSIKFFKQTLFGGSEKPLFVVLSYNVDLRTGKVLKMSDFFYMDAESEKLILNLIKKHNDQRCKFRTEHIFNNFCFDSEGIIFSFDDISNTSKSCYTEVVVPW
ncbi:MAG: hypothetical protein NZ521_08010, partial [Flammeovirgaceae bacterium]|nr:hypothetical protein [Flammeovirgaceae bacterium]MDW8288155.1 hypothetical protein [Flammeovirgaceae bacterium]